MRRLHTLRSLRRTYRNWVAISVALLFRSSSPYRVVLKDGADLGVPARRELLFQLADARDAGWSIRGGGDGFVVLGPRPGVSLAARWSVGFDVENAIEVFKDGVYAAPVEGRVVIDVGASIGDAALFFASEGASRVVALEPNPDSYRLAERNVAGSRFRDRITLLPVAAGAKDGSAELRMPSAVPNAASLAPAPAAESRWTFDRSVTVQVRSLDALILESATERVGLLKIDCQGSEYGLVASVSPLAWSLVDAVILEFTNGPADLPSRFRSLGFDVVTSPGNRGYVRASRPSR